MAESTFGERLHAAVAARGPLCVGVDPHPQQLRDWGLHDDVAGAERFSMAMAEAVAGDVAFVKPQSAFFERHGSAGVALLERLTAACRQAGALVILDVKRGDVGSTAAAYAQAYLHPDAPLSADAVTASPYLGLGSLQPMFDMAAAHGRGVFTLALTSNPEGTQVQHARGPDGRTAAQTIIDEVGRANRGAIPIGNLGVVVGATVGDCRGPDDAPDSFAHDLSEFNGPILAPGIGTQGGRLEDLPRVLGPAAHAAVPACSREIAGHGPDVPRLRTAARDLAQQCRVVLQR